ncbi:MAG: DUF6600 domain-containing protein [Acidobacteriota bacterium]
MLRPWTACLWVTLSLLGTTGPASAQDIGAADPSLPPPHLSVVEGTVVVDREGTSEPAAVNAPLLDGDRLRTGEGRAEVLFPDGTALHLDRQTAIDLLAPDLLRLMQGRIYVIVAGDRDPGRAVRYQIDAPPASVQTNGPGEYRLEALVGASGEELALAVVTGSATLATDAGAVALRAGERAVAVAGVRPYGPEYYNSARWDAFDRWSMVRRDERRGTVSVEYLSQEMAPYAGWFDRYGTWRHEPDYGYVWYPAVAADWRPYWSGYWRPYPAWNSFWVSADPWGWPTHHYGRWGFSLSFGWYWIPGRSWGAAWVHWAVAPGYVSWCPLGFSDRPLFGLWGVHGHVAARWVDPWRGWTVLPRRHFGTAVSVSHVALDGNRLDRGVRGAFIAQRAAPVTHVAVPRVQRADAGAPSGSSGRVPREAGASRRATAAAGNARSAGVPAPRGMPGVSNTLPSERRQTSDSAGDVQARRTLPGSSATRRPGGDDEGEPAGRRERRTTVGPVATSPSEPAESGRPRQAWPGGVPSLGSATLQPRGRTAVGSPDDAGRSRPEPTRRGGEGTLRQLPSSSSASAPMPSSRYNPGTAAPRATPGSRSATAPQVASGSREARMPRATPASRAATAPPATPSRGATSPRSGAASPRSGAVSPRTGAVSPRSGAASPRSGAASPRSGAASPRSGAASPRSGAASASRGAVSPRSGQSRRPPGREK